MKLSAPLSVSLFAALVTSAPAAGIALNFSQNDSNQSWYSTPTDIGPTSVSSANFNNTNNPTGGTGLPTRAGTLANGSITDLQDSDGNATTADVTWAASTTYWNGSGTGTNATRQYVGYLDDGDIGGGNGATINVTSIPYTTYDVYILLGSDQGASYTSLDFQVNGNAVIGSNFSAEGNWSGTWTEATSSQSGNYLHVRGLTGTSLEIIGGVRSGTNRGSVSGIVINQVPEPASTALVGLGGLALILRRRR